MNVLFSIQFGLYFQVHEATKKKVSNAELNRVDASSTSPPTSSLMKKSGESILKKPREEKNEVFNPLYGESAPIEEQRVDSKTELKPEKFE